MIEIIESAVSADRPPGRTAENGESCEKTQYGEKLFPLCGKRFFFVRILKNKEKYDEKSILFERTGSASVD